MEQLINLAKGVIIMALRDLIFNTANSKTKHQGTPYIDNKDNFLFSNIKKEMIDIETVRWFESDSREQYSFLYWNNYAGLNPNCIKKYVSKLRLIYEGFELEDERKDVPTVDEMLDGLETLYPGTLNRKVTAKGYLPYARPTQKGRKWMNV